MISDKPAAASAQLDSRHDVWHEILPSRILIKGLPPCKVYSSSFSPHLPHFLVAAAEDQDSSLLAPPGNQEEIAGSHTNDLPPVEGDIGDDRSLHPDTNSRKEHPVIEEQETTADPIDVVMHDEPNEDAADLLLRIRGLYRLLDLINEQGSGGAGMIKTP